MKFDFFIGSFVSGKNSRLLPEAKRSSWAPKQEPSFHLRGSRGNTQNCTVHPMHAQFFLYLYRGRTVEPSLSHCLPAGFSQEPQPTLPRVRFLNAKGMHCKAAQICCLLPFGRGNCLRRKICQIAQVVQVFVGRVPSLFLFQHLISLPQPQLR